MLRIGQELLHEAFRVGGSHWKVLGESGAAFTGQHPTLLALNNHVGTLTASRYSRRGNLSIEDEALRFGFRFLHFFGEPKNRLFMHDVAAKLGDRGVFSVWLHQIFHPMLKDNKYIERLAADRMAAYRNASGWMDLLAETVHFMVSKGCGLKGDTFIDKADAVHVDAFFKGVIAPLQKRFHAELLDRTLPFEAILGVMEEGELLDGESPLCAETSNYFHRYAKGEIKPYFSLTFVLLLQAQPVGEGKDAAELVTTALHHLNNARRTELHDEEGGESGANSSTIALQ